MKAFTQTSNLTTHQGINTIVNQVNGYMWEDLHLILTFKVMGNSWWGETCVHS